MKKVNLFATLAVAAALTLGVTGCSKDDNGGPGGGAIEPGKPTAMELTIYAPRAPQTYAADDNNATDGEIEMKTLNVLIYAETSLSGHFVLEKSAALTRADFETALSNPDTYVMKDASKITTTTGNKKLYVLMNYPGTLPAIGSPLTSLPNLEYALTAADALSANGLAMSSVEEKAATLVAETTPGTTPAANKVTIAVKRMVAKVTVQENIARTNGNIESHGGILTNLQFALGHANKSIYAFQKKVGAAPSIVVQDPNWSSYAPGDFFGISSYALASTDYQDVDAAATATLSLKTAYVPENTAATYNVDGDNLTYISVRAQYQPEFFSDDTGASKGPNSDPAKTFWVVSHTDGSILYFDNVTEASTYQANTAGSTMSAPYTDGLCYFRAYINKNGTADGNIPGSAAAKFDVLRNNYYKATINSITAPGKPIDEGKVTEETTLICDIEIQPWALVEEGHDL